MDTMTKGWAVTLEYEGTVPVDDLLDALVGHGATIAAGDRRWSVTLSVHDDVPAPKAAMLALTYVQRAAARCLGTAAPALGQMITMSAITFAEQDRLLDEPAFPKLVGIAEIAELLGVSRQRASELQTRPGFPAAVAKLKSGPVWRKGDLSRFADTWERKSGRPRRAELPHDDTIERLGPAVDSLT
jgi:hypothetical protein